MGCCKIRALLDANETFKGLIFKIRLNSDIVMNRFHIRWETIFIRSTGCYERTHADDRVLQLRGWMLIEIG